MIKISWKYAGWIIGLLMPVAFFAAIILGFRYWWFHPAPDIIRTVSLPGTSWVIEDRVVGHVSAMNGGYSEIAAKNQDTGEDVKIVVFKEPIDARISIGTHNQIIITVPITADIAEKRDGFEGISVVYNFLSKNETQQPATLLGEETRNSSPKQYDWNLKDINVKNASR